MKPATDWVIRLAIPVTKEFCSRISFPPTPPPAFVFGTGRHSIQIAAPIHRGLHSQRSGRLLEQ